MTGTLTVSLLPHQVPEPPAESDVWADWLRWLVMVMNPGDPQLGFIASLLRHAMQHGSLTPRQAAAANNVIRRVQVAYYRGDLHCLKTRSVAGRTADFGLRLAVDNTKEGA